MKRSHFAASGTRLVVVFLSFVLLSLPDAADGQQTIWSQPWDVNSQVGQSSQTSRNPIINREVSDDFEVVGTVQQVQVEGEYITYFNGPQINLQSVFVRFYEWQNGLPGAQQYERQIPASAITVTTDSLGTFNMRFALPDSFAAGGRHFISVQTVSERAWYWRTANGGKAKLAPAKVRDRGSNGAWTNANGSDAAFTLTGTLTGPPQLQSLSEASLSRSGRLRLFGTNFGASAASSGVRIGGVPAIVTSWKNTEIHAYVPEALTPGSYNVQVLTNAGASSLLPLTVTNRASPGRHARWRFQVDSFEVSADPVVGPDGTVYVMDDSGNLYALNPDGGLIWATKSGGQGSRLTRGFDGTLYTLADGILRATNADGTHKWDFGPTNFTISGPTVGPDGNIYGTTQLGPYGFFSVTPEGQLRWAQPSVVDRIPRDFEIVFSEGQAYINHRLNPQAGTFLMAFRMSDGALAWQRDAYNPSQPLIGPGGRIYVSYLLGVFYNLVYQPNGELFSTDEIGLGLRSFNPNKTRLNATTPSGNFISGLDPISLSPIWRFDTGMNVDSPPRSDPTDRFVVARTSSSGVPGSLLVLTSDGQFVQRDDLPAESGGNIILTSGPVFSPDGDVAYLGSAIPAYNPIDYSYVYAFDIAGGSERSSETARISLSPAGGITISWTAKAGKTYEVRRSQDVYFATYEVVASKLAGIEPETSYTDNSVALGAGAKTYYRVVSEP